MTGLPLNIDIQQILLHMLNFVILAGGLYILLYKPVKDFMDKRAQHYKQMDDAAQDTLESIKAQEAEYNSKIAGIQQEIDEMRSQAADKVRAESDERLAKAESEAQTIREKAREEAKREHDKMISDARDEVAKLAADAAKKLLEQEQDIYSSFADAASKE